MSRDRYNMFEPYVEGVLPIELNRQEMKDNPNSREGAGGGGVGFNWWSEARCLWISGGLAVSVG